MKIVLKAGETLLGHAEIADARTDPPMGCGQIAFHPSDAYSRVEDLFRQKTHTSDTVAKRDNAEMAIIDRALSEFQLSLATDEGTMLSVAGFTVIDYRTEMPDEPLILEFVGMSRVQFDLLFPHDYEAYEKSFKSP